MKLNHMEEYAEKSDFITGQIEEKYLNQKNSDENESMETVFLLRVTADEPEEAGGYNGFTSNRTKESFTIHVVNGQEEIRWIQDVWESIEFRVNGFVCDSDGEPIGIYLQTFIKEEEDERYELLLNHTIKVDIPTALPSYGGEDYDVAYYTMTLEKPEQSW